MLDGYFSLCILETMNNEIPFNTVKFLPDAEYVLPCITGEYIKTSSIGLNCFTSLFEPIDLQKKDQYLIPVPTGEVTEDNSRTYRIFSEDMPEVKEDYNLGQFLGLFAGDGWWDKPQYNGRKWTDRKIHLADVLGYNYAFVENYLKNILCVKNYEVLEKFIPKEEASWCEGDSRKFSISFDQVDKMCEFLTQMLGGERGLTHNGAGNKCLNFDFKTTNTEFKKGLLAGLISSDGSVSMNHAFKTPRLIVNYSTISKKLASNIKELAHSLNLHATLTFDKRPTVSGNKVYVISFSVVGLKTLQILDDRMAYKPKFEIFKNASVDISKYKYDYIPCTKEFLKEIEPFIFFRKTQKFDRRNPTEEQKKLIEDANIADSVFRFRKCGYATKHFIVEVLMPAVMKNVNQRKQEYECALNLLESSELLEHLSKAHYDALQKGFKSCFTTTISNDRKLIFDKGSQLFRKVYWVLHRGKEEGIKNELRIMLLNYFREIKPLSYNVEFMADYTDKFINNSKIKWLRIK